MRNEVEGITEACWEAMAGLEEEAGGRREKRNHLGNPGREVGN